jgi:hypothetical protein
MVPLSAYQKDEKSKVFDHCSNCWIVDDGRNMTGSRQAMAQNPNQGSAPVTIVNPLPLPVTGSVSGSVSATQSGTWNLGINGIVPTRLEMNAVSFQCSSELSEPSVGIGCSFPAFPLDKKFIGQFATCEVRSATVLTAGVRSLAALYVPDAGSFFNAGLPINRNFVINPPQFGTGNVSDYSGSFFGVFHRTAWAGHKLWVQTQTGPIN